jgi:putative acyl-CoA dehydrogenase
MEGFLQEPPRLGNQYLEDTALRELLQRILPEDVLQAIEPDLTRWGHRVVEDCWPLARNVEEHKPYLVNFNAWGKRIDEIRIGYGWKKLDAISAEEGLIAIPYERKYGEYSRVYQFAKLHMFGSYSGVYTCPLAMTDGAARLCELLTAGMPKSAIDADSRHPYSIQQLYKHFLSREPGSFWTSGQWMTERTGGSDVSNTETIAKQMEGGPDGMYRLYGLKFFTSATLSQVSFALGRIVDASGKAEQGSRGLSLFYVILRKEDGSLNNIKIHRLKDKLGTRSLPTAELELCGTPARLVSPIGRGVATISALFNITRLYTAVGSSGALRKSLAVARDYAHRRKAFGKPLSENPLHLHTLAELEVTYRGILHLAFQAALLQGKAENGKASKEELDILRLITPLAKLYTSRLSLSGISECMEALGGAGYMEDATDLPAVFRGQQVNTIWEGTTNVLSQDVLRVLARHPSAFIEFKKQIERTSNSPHIFSSLTDGVSVIKRALAVITQVVELMQDDMDNDNQFRYSQFIAREFAFALASTYISYLLLLQALWPANGEANRSDETAVNANVFKAWCVKYVEPSVLPLDHRLRVIQNLKSNKEKAGSIVRTLNQQIEASTWIALDVDPVSGKARGMGNVCPITGKVRASY